MAMKSNYALVKFDPCPNYEKGFLAVVMRKQLTAVASPLNKQRVSTIYEDGLLYEGVIKMSGNNAGNLRKVNCAFSFIFRTYYSILFYFSLIDNEQTDER